jgi:hypothetical protein
MKYVYTGKVKYLVEVWLHVFLIPALFGGEWIEGWEGPRAGLHMTEKTKSLPNRTSRRASELRFH